MCLKFVGAFLLILPFLSLTLLFGDLPAMRGATPPQMWFLGTSITAVLAWLVTVALPEGVDEKLLAFIGANIKKRGRTALFLSLVLLVIALSFISAVAFQHKPLLVDNIAQLFQARIFASGEVTVPAPPYSAFFVIQHILFDSGKLYAQYPPLHPALLALGVLAGKPWLMPVLLSTATVILAFLFARIIYGENTAVLTLLFFMLCPFFLFMSASFMNHVSALFFVTLFFFAFARWEESGSGGMLSLAAIAIAGAFLVRPLTAVAIGIPVGAFALPSIYRRREYVHSFVAAVCCALVLSVYFLFNAKTTGDPLLPGYLKLWGSGHGLGFHESPWGDVHTPLTGLRNELIDLSFLNEYLFEWPTPALFLLACYLLFAGKLDKWSKRLLIVFAAIPVAYFFYWHRDQFLGPRFMYESLIAILPLYAHLTLKAFDALGNRSFQLLGLFKPVPFRAMLLVFLLTNFGYAACFGIPQRFEVYRTSLQSLKVDISREAQEQGVAEGLVFVAVSWGSRILAQMRELGVNAAAAEQAYRRVDHCLLHHFVTESTKLGKSVDEVLVGLSKIVTEAKPVSKMRINGDPTLRLRPNTPLTEDCKEELRYDQAGYTTYEELFLANAPDFDGPLVVARDMRGRNRELSALYPTKKVYLYRKNRLSEQHL